jgi:hypothetical protein
MKEGIAPNMGIDFGYRTFERDLFTLQSDLGVSAPYRYQSAWCKPDTLRPSESSHEQRCSTERISALLDQLTLEILSKLKGKRIHIHWFVCGANVLHANNQKSHRIAGFRLLHLQQGW